MVQTSTNTCDRASSEYLQARQATIDWLKKLALPPLPVAPLQDSKRYPKLNSKGEIEYQKDGVTPKPRFTGKNPSYLDANGKPHLVSHSRYQKRLATDEELELWFARPETGIGTLGGWHSTLWLDFDVKQFPNPNECTAAAFQVVARVVAQTQQQPFLERSQGGGWRIGVRVRQKPNFTNFCLTPNGSHVGEALGTGRFTVLAPTIGPSGNPYQSFNREELPDIESLESIGIYPTSRNKTGLRETPRPLPKATAVPGTMPLEMLGHDTSRNILRGESPTADRSEALTIAVREWYGWANWCRDNGVRVQGNPEDLADYAGTQLGIDRDRVSRILQSIEFAECHPAALYLGGESSCWKKIRRLDRATFEEKCPASIKEALSSTEEGSLAASGNEKVRASAPKALRTQIVEILESNFSSSQQLEALVNLARATGRQLRDIQTLASQIDRDREREEYRWETKRELDTLEAFKSRSLTLDRYLPESYAVPLTQMAQWMEMPSAAFLTALLPTLASCLHPATRFVACECLDFKEPPIVYAGLVTESGQRKSPLLRSVTKALKQLQQEEEERFKREQAKYEATYKEWEAKKESASLPQWKDGEPKPPRPIREFYIDKATTEAIDAIKSKQPDTGFACIKDELNGLFGSYGAYKQGRGEDKESVLSGFGGEGVKKNLKNGERVSLTADGMSIIGAIQPGVLRKRMGNFDDDQGEWGRFLWCLIPLKALRLPESDGTFALAFLKDLYASARELPAREYRFDREAKSLLRQALYELEQRRVNHPKAGMRAAIAKMGSYLVRLSGLLHIIWELNAQRIPSTEIPPERVRAARELVEFYLSQVTLIHAEGSATIGKGELSHRLSAILGKLQHFGQLTARMIQSSISWLRKANPNDLRQDLRELAKMGYGILEGQGNRLRLVLPNPTADPVDRGADPTVDRSGLSASPTEKERQPSAEVTAEPNAETDSHPRDRQFNNSPEPPDLPGQNSADARAIAPSTDRQSPSNPPTFEYPPEPDSNSPENERVACTLAYRQGDKVRVTSGESERVGDTGTIVTVEPERERPYHVIQDNYEFSGWFAASHLKRVYSTEGMTG